MDHAGFSDLFHELVVELGPLVDEPELREVAVLHAVVQSSLKQENHQKPIERDHTEGDVETKQPDNRDTNRVGYFTP